MKQIIECVPNFSEGRDKTVIDSIVAAIEAGGKSVCPEGIKLLDVDPGEATNRTVVTFVGSPEAVLEAAFQGEKRAAELIDMRKHHGEGISCVQILNLIVSVHLHARRNRDVFL